MITKTESLPASRVRLTQTVSAAEFKRAFEAELAHQAEHVKMTGFRPGKAPLKQVLVQVGRARIEAGAIDRAVSDVYSADLRGAQLNPVAQPSVEVTEYAGSEAEPALTFTAELDVLPDVQVAGYEAIRVAEPPHEPVDEVEVEKLLSELQRGRAALEEAPEGALAENGLWAELSFKGSVGGVRRPDMGSDRFPLILGEGSLIPGFEENVYGLGRGESKTFSVTFPAGYHAAALAGKEAEFSVTVNELKRIAAPPLDEEFAKSYGKGSLLELKDQVRANLLEEKEEARQRKLEELVLDALLALAAFELPASMHGQEGDRLLKDARSQVERGGLPFDEYLKRQEKTEAEYRGELMGQAEKNVKIGLMLGRIIQLEKIQGDGTEVMLAAVQRLKEIATQAGPAKKSAKK